MPTQTSCFPDTRVATRCALCQEMIDEDPLAYSASYLAPDFSCHLRCARDNWNLMVSSAVEAEGVAKLPKCVDELVSMLMSGGGSSRFMHSWAADTVELCGWPGRGQDDGPLGWPGNSALVPPARLYEFPSTLLCFRGLNKLEVSEHPIAELPAHGWREFSTLQRLILSSLRLQELPEEIADIKSLRLLFVMQNMLRRLPCALGRHQQLVQLRGTGNQIAALPEDFGPPCLECLELEGNCITSCPSDLLLRCQNLRDLRLSGNAMGWDFVNTAHEVADTHAPNGSNHVCHLAAVHLQGCRLTWLPRSMLHLCSLSLRYLMLNNNQLCEPLPDALAHLQEMEKLHLYGNRLQELPSGLVLGCKRLSQLLLEDNPLSAAQLDVLLRDVQQRDELKTSLHVVGLDAVQVRRWRAGVDALASLDLQFDEPGKPSVTESNIPTNMQYRRSLPPCVQSGWRVMSGTSWYGKLIPSSQICRKSGSLTLGEHSGDEDFRSDANSRVLMVAFAASGGEPEWAKALTNLHYQRDCRHALQRYSLRPTLQDHIAKVSTRHQNVLCKGVDMMANLWADFNNAPDFADGEPPHIDKQEDNEDDDFDVLLLVDPCRSWYTRDGDLRRCLEAVTTRYGRVCAIGASMGGFAAMSCADIVDAVLAFGPQIDLQFAQHRPGFDLDALREASDQMRYAVANRRGSVECHTSMDAHLAQAQLLHSRTQLHTRVASSFPGDLRLIVHPMIGRIAHSLDEASLLVPLLANALNRLQKEARHQVIEGKVLPEARCSGQASPRVSDTFAKDEWPSWQWPFVKDECEAQDSNIEEHVVLVGHWSGWVRRGKGWLQPTLQVVAVTPAELLTLAQHAPYVGSWFCPSCGSSNDSRRPRCKQCKSAFLDALEVVVVPGGGSGFRKGDWECSWCELLERNWDSSCTACGRPRSDQTCCNTKCATHPDVLAAELKPFRRNPVNKLAYCSGCWSSWDNRSFGDRICCNVKCTSCPEALAAEPKPFRCDPSDQLAYCSGCWGVWDR